MRVRESLPSFAKIGAHYIIDPLSLIAHQEDATTLWVLTEYLSKVATWRRLRKTVRPHPMTYTEFWNLAYEALEGAPEWLREAYITHVNDHISIPRYEALRVSYRPKDLP